MPVPVRVTVCGLWVLKSLMVRPPVRVPALDGLKVMVTEQLAPAARVFPQVVAVISKSPLVATLVMPRASVAGPVLLKVTVCAALV